MYKQQARVGGELVRYPVCFSHDERCIYTCVGGAIKVYNTNSGILHGEFHGHSARVSGVFLNPMNTLQLYSSSHDGTIKRWDPSEGSCLQTYNVGIPILSGSIGQGNFLYTALDPAHYTKFLPAPPTAATTKTEAIDNVNDSQAKAQAIQQASKLGNKAIYICSLDLSAPQDSHISTDHFFTTKQVSNPTQQDTQQQLSNPLSLLFTMTTFKALARSRYGDLLCAVGGRDIYVYSKAQHKWGVMQHPQEITCVDVHPKLDILAIGDVTGRITLYINANSILDMNNPYTPAMSDTTKVDNYKGIKDNSARSKGTRSTQQGPISTPLHWHSSPVNSAQFSIDGNYLLSGGYECTLVTWQLSTMTQHFLPRLSSYISHISISSKGGVYAMSCGDNSIQTLSAYNSSLKHVVRGISILNPTNRLINTTLCDSLVFQNKIVCCTEQGHLQVFDVANDIHITTYYLLTKNNVTETLLSSLSEHERDLIIKNNPQKYQHLLNNGQNNQLIHHSNGSGALDQCEVTYLTISPDTRWSCALFMSPSANGIRIWLHEPSQLLPSTQLTTTVVWNDPHGAKVISATFSPTSKVLCTGHSDGKVRIWGLYNTKHVNGDTSAHISDKLLSWKVQNTFEYQSLLPTKITVSDDGSLVAIAFNNIFTIWGIDNTNYALSFLFSHNFAGGLFTEIIGISFLPQYPTCYVATQHGLYTFDLLTLSCVGTYLCNIAGMCTHPTLPVLFVITVVPHVKDSTNATAVTPAVTHNNKSNHNNKKNKETKAVEQPVLLKKPTKECCLLIFENNNSSEPHRAITLYDVLLGKTKTTTATTHKTTPTNTSKNAPNSTNIYTKNPYNTSCYECYISVTKDYFSYMNRSKELTIVPITMNGVDNLAKTGSNKVISNYNSGGLLQTSGIYTSIYRDIQYQQQQQVTEFGLDGTAATNAGTTNFNHHHNTKEQQKTLFNMITTLQNTPAHHITSLANIYTQFMSNFIKVKEDDNNTPVSNAMTD